MTAQPVEDQPLSKRPDRLAVRRVLALEVRLRVRIPRPREHVGAEATDVVDVDPRPRRGVRHEAGAHVGELAHVAGPRELQEGAERAPRQAHGLLLQRPLVLGEIVAQQRPYIRDPPRVAQGEQLHLEAVNSVVEILTEPLRRDFLLERPVRSQDDLHVHREDLGLADWLDGACLQHTQEQGLAVRGQFADLVQEQHSVVGGAEEAWCVRDRAGESPLDVPEQLRLGQVAPHPGAVELAEGSTASSLRVMVEVAGDELFPGPRLARDQDRRCIGAGRARQESVQRLAQLARGLALTDDLGPVRVLHMPPLGLQLPDTPLP